MKKFKKLTTLLVSMTIVGALFTGCGKAASDTSEKEASTPAPASQAAVSEEKEGGIGSQDKPVTVSILIKDVSPAEEDVILLKQKIEEGMAKNNQYVTVEFLEAPAGTYKEVVPLALRTGEIAPDIVYFQGGDQPIAQEGLLEDLTSYIDNSTYIKELMQEHHKQKIANYPYLLWLAPARAKVPVMRADWIEQLPSAKALIEDPTVDNYYNLFKEMKDKGMVQYGTSVDGETSRIDNIFNQAFGVSGSFVKEDGKWVSSLASQAQKDKLEFYAKLYKEGLLDSEYVTNTWDVLEQKFYEGSVGLIGGTAGGVIQIYNDKMVATNGEAAKIVVLPPAKGVGQGLAAIDVTKESRGMAITADSEVKEAAFAVLEYMASPEGRMLDKLGVEGVHYTINDGKIAITDKFPSWWARFWDTLYKFDPGMPYEKQPFSEATLASLEALDTYYCEDNNVLMPEELQPKWDAMNELYNEYSTDIIRGVRPISAFEEFVEKFNEAGGAELSEYVATQLQ